MSSAKIRIDVDDSQLQAKLKQQELKMRDSFNRMEKSGSVLDDRIKNIKNSFGSMIPVASMASAGLIFQQLLNTASNFSKELGVSMREVQTISKAAQDDFKGMTEDVVNLSAKGPASAIELSRALYQIVSAGHDGAKGLELLEVSARAAVAGVTDTKTAADGLTTILNAWSKEASEAEKVADAMFTTVKLGKTTFGELSQNIAQVAPLAASMKIPFEQILSAVATLTVQGTPTAQAVTQIRSSLVNLNKVLPEGWQNMYTYQEALQKVYEMAGGSQVELRKLIPDIEGINAVLGLSGEKAKTAAGHLQEFKTATGEMQTAYDRMMKEADNQWSQVHNKWMRELKQIGDASLIASTGTAQFFNAMLTGIEDIENKIPLVNGFFERIAALKMLGNNSLQAYFKALFTSDYNVMDDLGKIINQGNKGFDEKNTKLADILGIEDAKKRLEELDSFLKQVKDEQLKLDQFTPITKEAEAIDRLQRNNYSDLIKKISDAMNEAKKVDDQTGKSISKFKTVADAEAKIKELREKLGTGTVEQEVEIIAKIRIEEQFIDEFNKKVREKINEQIGLALTDSYGLNLKMKPLPTDKPDPKKLMPMVEKQLTAEQKKQLEIQKEQDKQAFKLWETEQKRLETHKDISKGLDNASEILGAMSFAVGQLDSDLGKSLGKLADLAYNASDLFKNLSTGNFVGAISSGIGVIGNIFSLFKGDEQETGTTRSLKLINNLLEQQSVILANLSEENYFELADKQYKDYGDAIIKTNDKLRSSNVKVKESYKWTDKDQQNYIKYLSKVDITKPNQQRAFNPTEFWSPGDFIDAYVQGSLELDEQQIAWITDITDKQKQRADLLQNTFRQALGFDADDISSSIFEGIEKGLRLGENSLGDFTESFGELMKQALMQGIEEAMNIRITEEFLSKYKDAMSDGELTTDELVDLQKIYKGIIEQAQVDANNIKKITDPYMESTPKQQGLTGAIRGITEETGGLIAGQFGAMRVDLQVIKMNTSLIQNQFEMMDRSLSVLNNIELNTRHNKRLNDVVDRIDKTNRLLEEKL